jgi:oxygen-independent coproporphyrinogen-3 oxidase
VRAEHLYIHVPFCSRRCVYCDFSIAVRHTVPVDEYLTALTREWEVRHRDSELALRTVYLGGGTPSKLGGDGVLRLMELVRSRSELADDVEVTLEANPEDVTVDAVRRWRNAGINRVSLGVQSFDDAVLAWMHRTHGAQEAVRSVEVLREGGIHNTSIDIIFGVPTSVPRNVQAELERVLALGVAHVSAYGLTVEPHTPLGRWVARESVSETPEEAFEKEFLQTHDALVSAGLTHYEVSNYGRVGVQSRHNWSYWERRPYAGLGPAAHEFDGVRRRWNTAPYADWVARLTQGRSSTVGEEVLDADSEQSESIYLGLRTDRGVALLADDLPDVHRWQEAGWATVGPDAMLRLTVAGWLRLDAIANHLTLLRSRSYI